MLPSDSARPAICNASSPALMSCGHHGRLASTSASAYRSRSSSRSSSSAPSGAAVFSFPALPAQQQPTRLVLLKRATWSTVLELHGLERRLCARQLQKFLGLFSSDTGQKSGTERQSAIVSLA